MLLTGLTLGISQEIKMALPGDVIFVQDTTTYMPSEIFINIIQDLKKIEVLSTKQDSLLQILEHNIKIYEEQIELLEEQNLILKAKTKRNYLIISSIVSLYYIITQTN